MYDGFDLLGISPCFLIFSSSVHNILVPKKAGTKLLENTILIEVHKVPSCVPLCFNPETKIIQYLVEVHYPLAKHLLLSVT